ISAQDSEEARWAACAACDISITLPRNSAAWALRAAASIGGAVLRTATFIMLSSCLALCERRDALRLVVVLRRQFWNGVAKAFGPGDDIVDALSQRDGVAPAELGAELETVQRIGGVLAGPFGADLDAVVE